MRHDLDHRPLDYNKFVDHVRTFLTSLFSSAEIQIFFSAGCITKVVFSPGSVSTNGTTL